MPPKSKFTREQIIDAAFELVRSEGASALRARNLAGKLQTSTAPIFTAFSSIDEIRENVVKKANILYGEYVDEGLKQTPAFKGFGMKYIEFAKDEPELFKLLFMSDENRNFSGNFLPNYDMYSPKVLSVLENTYMMTEETARRLYNHMSVYAFGFAALYAQGIKIFSMDEISRMISEVFAAMVKSDSSKDIKYLKSFFTDTPLCGEANKNNL